MRLPRSTYLTCLALAAPARAADPVELYGRLCAPCHGDRGDGRGPAARYLDPPPRDFTRGEYKFRSTPSGTPPLSQDLVRTIRRGLPGTAMPAWADLGAADIAGLVRVVRSFSPRLAGAQSGPHVPVPPAPRDLASLAREGRKTWDLLRCAECHGPRGRGDGPAVPTLHDGAGRPIRPADFTTGRYKGGSAPEDVYRTFMTGLDGTPMPSYLDTLDALGGERARWSLVAYVLSLGRHRTLLDWLLDDPTAAGMR